MISVFQLKSVLVLSIVTDKDNEGSEDELAKRFLLNILYVVFGVTLVGIGGSLTMKAGIGIAAIDAFNSSISEFTTIKVGTVSILVNVLLLFFQWLILKRDFKLFQLMQIPLSMLIGEVLNVMVYTVLPLITIESYAMNIVLLIIGNLIAATGVGLCTALNFVSFPLESLCIVLTKKMPFSFGKIRQSADVIFIISSLVLSLVLNLSFYIREGTILSALMFTPIMNFVYLNIHRILPLEQLKLESTPNKIVEKG